MSNRRVVLDFTVFEADGITPWFGSATSEGEVTEADFQTPDSVLSHARPYLKVPDNFTATEIDFLRGSSNIGAVSVGVMDKRLTATDQDTGQVTSKIKDAVGHRAVLRRWVPELSSYIKLMDGPITSYTLQDNPLIYWFHLEDGRAFEALSSGAGGGGASNSELFKSNFVLFGADARQGPPDDYGRVPHWYVKDPPPTDLPYLVRGVPGYVATRTFELDTVDVLADDGTTRTIYFGFLGVAPEDDFTFTRPDIIDLGEPTVDAQGITRYPKLRIQWREAGSSDAWTEVENMPRDVPAVFLRSGGEEAWAGRSAVYYSNVYLGSFDQSEVPANGQSVEFRILAQEITEETPFFWDNGSLGDLLKEIQAGTHTTNPPKERYDTAALDAFAASSARARFILREPVTDRRKWVEENIYKAALVAPSFNDTLEIVPADWGLPKVSDSTPLLDPDTIQPVGEWSAGGSGAGDAIGCVEFTYIHERLDPLKTKIVKDDAPFWKFWADDVVREVVDDDRYQWERLVETEVPVLECASDAAPGASTLKIAPITIRTQAGSNDQPTSGDTVDDLGNTIAERAFKEILPRFKAGTPRFECDVAATPENLQLQLGDWVRVRLPWIPEYSTAKRGARRLMQIYAISDQDPDLRRLRLQDGGVSDAVDGATADDEVDCLSGGKLYVSPEGYSMRVFTEDGFIVNNCSEAITLKRVALIAGGGSGGNSGTRGGGGAGGVIQLDEEDAIVIGPGESVPVHVGVGGVGDNDDGDDSILWVDANGFAQDPISDSPRSLLRARGGGAGGQVNGSDGGSGGGGGSGSGGGSATTTAGGSGFEDQGNDGGAGASTSCVGFCCRQSGGGGGSFLEDGKSSGGIGSSIGGDGGADTLLPDFGIRAGGGGQGGSHRDDFSGDCSSHGGTLEEPGDDGVGFGAGGGGAAGDVSGGDGARGAVALVYAGAPAALNAPTISSTEVTADNALKICITEADWPDVEYEDYRVRVEYATTETEPAADSGDWQLAGYLDNPGCVQTAPLPTGSTLWTRAIAEADDQLPSEESATVEDSVQDTPVLFERQLTVDQSTGIGTVSWVANDATEEVEIRAAIYQEGNDPPDPPPLIATVDGDLGEYELSTLVLAKGDLLTVTLQPLASDGTITEDTDGQIAHHISGDADNPFSTGDWTGDGASVAVSNGDLRVSNNGSNNRGARYTSDAARSEQMVRARMKYDHQHAFGPAVLSVGRDDLITLRWFMSAGEARLQEWTGGAATNLDVATGLAAKVADTYYWGGVWADTGGNAAGYDFEDDALVESSSHGRSADGQGAVSNRDPAAGAATSDTSHWYQDAGRYLEVTGMETGYTAKVLGPSDEVLAEDAEASGVSLVDLIGVDPRVAVVIQVTDASDDEVVRLTPSWDYIAGGSRAVFELGTLPDGPVYRVTQQRLQGTRATQADVVGVLDSLVLDDDLNLIFDDDLNPIRS